MNKMSFMEGLIKYGEDRGFFPEREKGCAGLNLDLSNSVITVRHSEKNKVLYKFNALKGDWNKIINLIEQLATRENK